MEETPIKRTVLDYDDIRKMVPFFDGKKRLVNFLLKFLSVDKVNRIHDHNCDTPGVPFTAGLLNDLNIKLRIDNEERLDNLPEGSFITVSNHPLGALDGIALIKIVGERRPKFKVMVNMVLNYISAMRPNFIAVDALASSDPKKKAVSMQGIKAAMMQVRSGEPMGFFSGRCSVEAEQKPSHRGPRMATHHHTPNKANEGARSAYLFSHSQQLVVHFSWNGELATAHTALACRSVPQEKRHHAHLDRRNHFG